MFDNYYTKYEDAKNFINLLNAKEIVTEFEKKGKLTAEEYAYLSKAYIYTNETPKAINAAKKSVKLDKNYPYGYIRLAFALGKNGEKLKAKQAVEQAEKVAEENWFFDSFFAALFGWLKEDDKKDFYLARLMNCNSTTPAYYYAVGFALSRPEIDECDKAVEYFLKAKDYKNQYELFYKLMLTYADLEDCENSIKYCDKLLELGETPDLLYRKAKLLMYEEEYEKAVPFLRKYYKTGENKAVALKNLAAIFALLEDDESDKPLKYLKFAERTLPPSEDIYSLLAKTYENRKEYEKAIAYSKRVLKLDNTDTDALSRISYCYSRMKEPELAALYADKALLLEPNEAYGYYRRGNIYADMNDFHGAVECYEKAVELEPTDSDYYANVSYAYSKLNKHELSLEFANRGLLVNKQDGYLNFRKAWALQELGKFDEAIKYYQRCIEANENYVDGYANISYCYSKMKEWKKSILYANQAILVNKDYAYAHYRKAWGLHFTEHFKEAKESYEYALKLDPSDTFSYVGLAATCLNLDDAKDALSAANSAILINRDYGEAYYFKGVALSNLGKTKEAEKSFFKAKELGYVK